MFGQLMGCGSLRELTDITTAPDSIAPTCSGLSSSSEKKVSLHMRLSMEKAYWTGNHTGQNAGNVRTNISSTKSFYGKARLGLCPFIL
jgi:hypothetical protein